MIVDSISESPQTLSNFNVVEDKKLYRSYQDRPELVEDTVTAYIVALGSGDTRRCFGLKTHVGEYTFIFYLFENYHAAGAFTFQSEIENYGFAIANLTKETREALLIARASFVESVSKTYRHDMKKIEASADITKYTVAEIDDCINEILQHPNNTIPADVLRTLAGKYTPNQLFDIYADLYGTKYFAEEPVGINYAWARKRIFESGFKKYLKTWEVVESPHQASYVLKPK